MSARFALFGNAAKPGGGKYSRIILASNLKPRRRGLGKRVFVRFRRPQVVANILGLS